MKILLLLATTLFSLASANTNPLGRGGYDASGSISTDKRCYEYGESIEIQFENDHPNRDDWMGIYFEPSRLRELPWPEMWLWLTGSQTTRGKREDGTITLDADAGAAGHQHWPLEAGEYRAMLALNDDRKPYYGYAETHVFEVKREGHSCGGPSPTRTPTHAPPTKEPTHSPTKEPTKYPTPEPTHVTPTPEPTPNPTAGPTPDPTPGPTNRPTTLEPSPGPTRGPTDLPTMPPNRVEVNRVCYDINEEIRVHFNNNNARTDDWIGIFPSDTMIDSDLPFPFLWLWTCGSQECQVAGSEGTLIFGPDTPDETGSIPWPLHGGSFVAALVNRNGVEPYVISQLSQQFLVDDNCDVNGPIFEPPSAAPSSNLEGIIYGVALEGGAEFVDPNSPQSRAFAYLMAFEDIDDCTEEEIVDAYALASLFFGSFGVETHITAAIFGEGNTPDWEQSDNWVTAVKPCDADATWFGVGCDDDGRVVSVDLSFNKLTGGLAHEITLLDELLKFAVYDNFLFNAGLEFIGDFDKIEVLDLGSNWLSHGGTPLEIAMLDNLRVLDLSSNLINGPLRDASFAGLDDLEELYLQFNTYNSSIPDSIINLDSLKILDLEASSLMGQDLDFIPKMTSLESLDLDSNPGVGGSIPTEIGMASKLMFLSIIDTGIHGPIPIQIGELSMLRKLWLESNRLTGRIPASLGDIRSLEILELSNNDLEGTMPEDICGLRIPLGLLESLEADCDIDDGVDNNVICSQRDCCTCCGRGCAESGVTDPTPAPSPIPTPAPPTDAPAPVAGPTPDPTPEPTPEPTPAPVPAPVVIPPPVETLPPSPGFPVCEACGANRVVTRPDNIVEIPGQPDQTCETIELAGQLGFIEEQFCPVIPAFINSICSCTDLIEPNPMHAACSICGNGMKVSNYDPIIILEGSPARDCGEVETAGRLGYIDEETCAAFPTGIDECNCVAV